jgi:hypothetical protein
MKKHPRILKLVTKLLIGHSMRFVDRVADDFASYREGTSDLHPALLAAFKRMESHFGVAFKHRHFINENHRLHTNIYGEPLLAIMRRREQAVLEGYYKAKGNRSYHFTAPLSQTLH